MARTSDDDRPEKGAEMPPVQGALGELIEVEKRVEAEVAEAEVEARQLVEAAQREAQRLGTDSSAALEEALHSLRTELAEESAALAEALAEGADAEMERYRRVDEVTVRRLAQWVASRVVRGSGAS